MAFIAYGAARPLARLEQVCSRLFNEMQMSHLPTGWPHVGAMVKITTQNLLVIDPLKNCRPYLKLLLHQLLTLLILHDACLTFAGALIPQQDAVLVLHPVIPPGAVLGHAHPLGTDRQRHLATEYQTHRVRVVELAVEDATGALGLLGAEQVLVAARRLGVVVGWKTGVRRLRIGQVVLPPHWLLQFWLGFMSTSFSM